MQFCTLFNAMCFYFDAIQKLNKMGTPTLSKKQIKKTLSSRKGSKETIKNLLANPYSNYFPLITNEDSESINNLLRDLPKLKPEKKNAPWSAIKDIPKEERKKARENYVEKIEIDEDIKQNLIFGVNNVTASLEKSETSCVLISSDVNPQFMVKHVIDLSVLKKVPVLIIHELRNTLKETTGIKSLTIAIKKCTKNPLLNLISDKISTIQESYPIPKRHIHSEKRLRETGLDENMQNLDLEKDEEIVIKDLLLKRKDASVRVFVPENSKKTSGVCTKMETDDSGFIAFAEASVEYKPLQVKRVRSNKDRKKKFKSC